MVISFFFITCTIQKKIGFQNVEKNPLVEILEKNPAFQKVVSEKNIFEPQVIFTQIDRDKNGFPTLKTWTWNTDTNRYFYPASTVKFPTALVALEWLNKQNIADLDKNTPIFHRKGHFPQTSALSDTSNFLEKNTPTVANYVKKILLVSDNDANNRLYELLGQQYLNETLRAKGYTQTRLIHRLQVSGFSPELNRWTNPVFFKNGWSEPYSQGEKYSSLVTKFRPNGEQKGTGFYRNDSLIQQPFDFSRKNFIGLDHLDAILKSVIFPEITPKNERFDLNLDDYQLIYRYMSMFPRESKSPRFAEPDGYCKFWLLGGSAEKAPANIRIFNKVGDAYGFLLDVAYVVDFESKTEFFVTAVLNCNSDGIYNDDKYDYDSVGYPFFVQLGAALLAHERARKRTFLPNLAKFRFEDYRE
jgi:hypothetical protein